eukprot:gene3462-2413_t
MYAGLLSFISCFIILHLLVVMCSSHVVLTSLFVVDLHDM